MTQETILYLHGFASSGQGAKAQYFREQFARLPQVAFQAVEFNPTPADFEYMTLTGLINRLRQYLLGQPPGNLSFIASSLGALVGLHYAHRFGGVRKMLLLAPALAYRPERRPEEELQQWQAQGVLNVAHYAYKQEVPLRFDFHLDGLRYLQPVPPAAPTIIVHGRQDEVVAIEHSRAYAAHFPDQVHLVEVDADHQLSDQLAFIWQQVQSFLLSGDEPSPD
ncbi:MAG: esterase [Anaerolineae bacterium]|nr:esterase [Anaerolineae bacterium]